MYKIVFDLDTKQDTCSLDGHLVHHDGQARCLFVSLSGFHGDLTYHQLLVELGLTNPRRALVDGQSIVLHQGSVVLGRVTAIEWWNPSTVVIYYR